MFFIVYADASAIILDLRRRLMTSARNAGYAEAVSFDDFASNNISRHVRLKYFQTFDQNILGNTV